MGITLTQTQLIPTNVVEVGNELSQNVLNGLSASGSSASNPAVPMSTLYGRVQKTNPTANANGFDYESFKVHYPSELLISTNYGQFYIPVR
jgi:hypothetical protein